MADLQEHATELEERNSDICNQIAVHCLDAADQIERLARYIVNHGPYLPDWACSRCVVDPGLLVPGFVCAKHLADDIVAALPEVPRG